MSVRFSIWDGRARGGNKKVAWVIFIRIFYMFMNNGYNIGFVSVFSYNFPMNFYYLFLFPKHDN